jgi:predicted MFS family arabinose efflux permease
MRTLIVLSVLNHTAYGGSRVAMSLAGLQLQASPFAIGLILSFYSLLPAFVSVAAGRWIDRVGMRRPMLMGTALLAFGVCVPFIAWDIGSLYLASVTIGVGFMAFHLCTQKAAGDIGDEGSRKLNFSLLSLGFSISGFLGPTSTGLLIDAIGHRATFGVLVLLPLATLLGLRRFHFIRKAQAVPPVTGEAGDAGRLTDLLRDPELKRLYVAVVLISASWDVHQFIVPLYGARLGLSASSIGVVLGAFAAATFVIRMALPFLMRRVAEWPLILTAMTTATTIYALYPFFPAFPVMLAMSFVLGLGLGVSQPMILSILHRASPPGRVGEAGGLRLMLINGTQTLLPTTFGAFGAAFGLAPLFWGMSLLVAGGAWYAGRGRRPPPPAPHRMDRADDEGLM